MSVHYDHPCRTAREHIVVTIARQEDASPADFLDRFDHEREEEERLLARETVPDLIDWAPGELMERHGL
jgi:hypothetical protein